MAKISNGSFFVHLTLGFRKIIPLALIVFGMMLFSAGSFASSEANDDSISRCLKAWGQNPFGQKPKFKTLSTSVKVFGIGDTPKDTEATSAPALVLVNPAVNVMGGTVYELMNPNGWYCFRANVNVMGGLIIKTHCKSHLASSSDGATVMGSNTSSKAVTVMGSTKVEIEKCN